MDQESFRKLLQTNRSGPSVSAPHSSTQKPKTKAEPSQPIFKPRKVKKETETAYRDRAAERRLGGGNDYAHVEALLEDFERQRADNEDKVAVEEQRRYLGGDGDHSILVKGLDIALMEQNKARAALSNDLDDSLEQVFLETSSGAPPPKKKTREEYIRQLKETKAQRNGEAVNGVSTLDGARSIEEAKKARKFKPIGLKPTAVPAEGKPKRKKTREKGDGGTQVKKRKIEGRNHADGARTKPGDDIPQPSEKSTDPLPPIPAGAATEPEPEPEPIDDKFDIFADAGDYQGIELSDDGSDGEEATTKEPLPVQDPKTTEPSSAGPSSWFPMERATPPLHDSEPQKSEFESKSTAPPPDLPPTEEEDPEQPLRLIPLESSALPSIKDFLALDDATKAQEIRQKRKDKRKGGKGDGERTKLSAELKAERDYKRLESYKEKKGGGN